MDQQWNTPDNSSMMTPPVEGGFVEEKPTKWPTVIGVIGIVLASMGLVCGCAGYFAVPLQRWGASMQSQSGHANPISEAQLRVGEQYQIFTIVLTTIGLGMSLWLLMGSISLVRRKRSARTALIGWASVSILMLAVNICYQVLTFQAVAADLQQHGEAQHTNELWIGAAVAGCMGILFGLAMQVFALVWFSRAKVKNEIAQWR